jgi:hypothetical protein
MWWMQTCDSMVVMDNAVLEPKPRKPSIFRRFWWMILTVLLFSIIVAVSLVYVLRSRDKEVISDESEGETIQLEEDDPYAWVIEFSEEELQHANQALSGGITINAPENDFYHPPEGSVQADGRPDNPNPYPIPFTDLKRVTVGADGENLYVKYEFWGEFPTEAYVYENEMIHAVGAKMTEFTFTDSDGDEDVAELDLSVMYIEKPEGVDPRDYPPMNPKMLLEYRITPLGLDETMETIFESTGNSDIGRAFGGPGYDYLLGSYPLSLFDISLGDIVEFSVTTESGSTTFHHEGSDFLLDAPPPAKSGSKIQYTLGEDTYEDLGVSENMKME